MPTTDLGVQTGKPTNQLVMLDMVVCCWRFITTMVLQRQVWVCTLGSFSLGFFCVLVVFPAALPHTVRLVRRLQYQFTRSWKDPAESRTFDLPASKRTHLPLDHGPRINWFFCPDAFRFIDRTRPWFSSLIGCSDDVDVRHYFEFGFFGVGIGLHMDCIIASVSRHFVGILLFQIIIILITIFIKVRTAFFNTVFLRVFVTLSLTS